MPYEVSTPAFAGPFDLLLHLILKEEVDLWEISLERIIDAFVGARNPRLARRYIDQNFFAHWALACFSKTSYSRRQSQCR